MSCTRTTTLAFLFWSYFPLLCLKLILCPLCNSNTLWIILMVLGRNVQQDKTTCLCTRMTTLSFLLLALSPFVIFDTDYALTLCPLCKSNTLWNIFIILCRNVEQDKMTWCTKMTTLAFLLLELSPFIFFEIEFVSAL